MKYKGKKVSLHRYKQLKKTNQNYEEKMRKMNFFCVSQRAFELLVGEK